MQNESSEKGFSLIEMAVVLVIVGLLLGGMLVPLSTQMETDRRKETTATLASIREALIGFALINGRLPCPDVAPFDGRENCPSGAPNGGPKRLPFADLGVSSTDAWGNTWTYAVTNAFTTTFTLATVGNINVGTAANNCAAATRLASNVPALVRSNGRANNTTSTFETENTDPDACYTDAGFRQTGNQFDDLIVWIPPGVLFNRMVAAGRLP